ncbi:MAG: hypothetical protein PHV49_03395 [Alistipes sp.]|nr:hypothetical protein [Alistipes sp.]
MDSVFSLRRFMSLALNQWTVQWKGYVATYAALVFYYGVLYYTNFRLVDHPDATAAVLFFVVGLFVTLLIRIRITVAPFITRSTTVQALTLPCSVFEKYLFVWGQSLFMTLLLYGGAFFTVFLVFKDAHEFQVVWMWNTLLLTVQVAFVLHTVLLWSELVFGRKALLGYGLCIVAWGLILWTILQLTGYRENNMAYASSLDYFVTVYSSAHATVYDQTWIPGLGYFIRSILGMLSWCAFLFAGYFALKERTV